MNITGPTVDVLGVAVEPLDMTTALHRVATALTQAEHGYICMVGAHGVVEAQRDRELGAIYTEALMTVPDGIPTVWLGWCQGHKHMQRVAGPDLMAAICGDPRFADRTHFLYGGDQGVAPELKRCLERRFPWIKIVGIYTPPFRDLNPVEEAGLIAQVNSVKPDFLWVGISTPRQEHFMARHQHLLDATLMLGVGAAFDFHTGRLADAPSWVKQIGMQWLHRLLQDPRRLWRRYLRTNTIFLLRLGFRLATTGTTTGRSAPRPQATPLAPAFLHRKSR